MSMNLHVNATIMANSHLGEHKINEQFDLWQTPTDDTYRILKESDIAEAYRNWIRGCSKTEKVPVFEDDDIFQENGPIGYEDYNPGEIHIEDLNEWLESHKGWDIEWFDM